MNPTIIDMNKVNSQKSRQILDLYIGFTISPILWKFIQHKLSAGRCQTPALKMIYEREVMIQNQTYDTKYIITGIFNLNKSTIFLLFLYKIYRCIDKLVFKTSKDKII
jgi:DNA topoisomerase-1